jgi:hypothetical protein
VYADTLARCLHKRRIRVHYLTLVYNAGSLKRWSMSSSITILMRSTRSPLLQGTSHMGRSIASRVALFDASILVWVRITYRCCRRVPDRAQQMRSTTVTGYCIASALYHTITGGMLVSETGYPSCWNLFGVFSNHILSSAGISQTQVNVQIVPDGYELRNGQSGISCSTRLRRSCTISSFATGSLLTDLF